MRSAVLTAGSLVLTGLVLANAWIQRQQFYPSVVYITKSNPSMAVIYLQSLVLVILMGKVMRKIFFGRLRAAEFEHLMERSWYAVTETCLAFTVFKDDFSPKFVALFTVLLFLKSFHWLAEDRVDYMERSPVITILFHLRVLSLAIVLASLDMFFIQHAYSSTLTKGASVQLVFGFEYAILLTIVMNTLVKYILHSIDLHSENPWENKAVFMLYTELMVGLIKVLLYVLFFVIMVRIYTLPLFAVRPMYLTMRAFKKAFNDVVLSRRAIHNMNTLYPDATAEELENSDNVCIICREEMTATATKKLPCGHIFHRNCLRSWFQRQQTCPTCRLDVLRVAPTAAGRGAGGQQQAAANPAVAAQFQAQMAALRNQLEAMQAQRQQPAGGQQQAAQQPQIPNFFNLLAGGQLGAVPPQAAPAAPAPPAPPTAQPTTPPPAAEGATASTAAPPANARAPFPFPPFPFLPFNVPPPMPPPNFTGLSDSELGQMEGRERKNVEARIKCLRNIQVLLDAAVMEMQQYSAVVARCSESSAEETVVVSSDITSSKSSTSSVTTSALSSAVSSSTSYCVTSSSGLSSTSVTSISSNVAPGISSSSVTSLSANVALSSGLSTSSVTSLPSNAVTTGSSSTSVTDNIPSTIISPAETGARPKVALTDKSKEKQEKSCNDKFEEKNDDKSSNPFKLLSDGETSNNCSVEHTSERTAEQEEIRKRRLVVFEEQKKRLMSK